MKLGINMKKTLRVISHQYVLIPKFNNRVETVKR